MFCDAEARHLTVNLPKEEAAAVAEDPLVEPARYGLGRYGSFAVTVDGTGDPRGADRWRRLEEWVRTSYTLVAPRRLAALVTAEDEASR